MVAGPSRSLDQSLEQGSPEQTPQIERPALWALYDRQAQRDVALAASVHQFSGAPRGTRMRAIYDELLDGHDANKVFSRHGAEVPWGPNQDEIKASLIEMARSHRNSMGVRSITYQYVATPAISEMVMSGRAPFGTSYRPFNGQQLDAVKRAQGEINRELYKTGGDLEKMDREGLSDTPEYRSLAAKYDDLKNKVIVTPQMEEVGRIRYGALDKLGREHEDLEPRTAQDLRIAGSTGSTMPGQVRPFENRFQGWQNSKDVVLDPKILSQIALQADPNHEPGYHQKVASGDLTERNSLESYLAKVNEDHRKSLDEPITSAPPVGGGLQEHATKNLSPEDVEQIQKDAAAANAQPKVNVATHPGAFLEPPIDQALERARVLDPRTASAKTLEDAFKKLETEVRRQNQRQIALATVSTLVTLTGTAAEMASAATGHGHGLNASSMATAAGMTLNTLTNVGQHIHENRQKLEASKKELSRQETQKVVALADEYAEVTSNGLKHLQTLNPPVGALHGVEVAIREKVDREVEFPGNQLQKSWEAYRGNHSVEMDRAVLMQMAENEDPNIAKVGRQGLTILDTRERENPGATPKEIHDGFEAHFRQLNYRNYAGNHFESRRSIQEGLIKEDFMHSEVRREVMEHAHDPEYLMNRYGITNDTAQALGNYSPEQIQQAYTAKWRVEREMQQAYFKFTDRAPEAAHTMERWGIGPRPLLDSVYGRQDTISTHDLRAADAIRATVKADRNLAPDGWSSPYTGEGKVGVANLPGEGTLVAMMGYQHANGASVAKEAKLHFFENRRTGSASGALTVEERRFTITLDASDLKKSPADLARVIQARHNAGDPSTGDKGAVLPLDNRTAISIAKHLIDSRTPAGQAQAAMNVGSLFSYPDPASHYDPDAIERLKGDFSRAKDELGRHFDSMAGIQFTKTLFQPKADAAAMSARHGMETAREDPLADYNLKIKAVSTHKNLGHEALLRIVSRYANAGAPQAEVPAPV